MFALAVRDLTKSSRADRSNAVRVDTGVRVARRNRSVLRRFVADRLVVVFVWLVGCLFVCLFVYVSGFQTKSTRAIVMSVYSSELFPTSVRSTGDVGSHLFLFLFLFLCVCVCVCV